MPSIQATTGSKLLRNTYIPAGPVQLANGGGKVLDRDEAILQTQGLDVVCFDAPASPPRYKFDQPAAAAAASLSWGVADAPTPLAVGLEQLLLGGWRMLGREFVKVFHAVAGEHRPLLTRLHGFLSRAGRDSLREAMDGEDNLISFRNAYAHGATPADENCFADLAASEHRFRRLREESRRYALRHLAAHARAVLDESGLDSLARATELDRLHHLASCEEYQQASFEKLGSATAYQAHCRLLLERLADMDADRRAYCGAHALWQFHVQPELRHKAILDQIDAGADDLRRLEQFAAMGRTPRDRALLALRGLAARRGLRVPAGLQKRLGEWCEQTASKALAELCRPFLANSDLKL